jgi:four helix bundle protein
MNAETPQPEDLKTRTKAYALRIIRLYTKLPQTFVAQTIGKQVLRSGTSVGAQYREGMRSRSNAEIISKLESSLQELEETVYWLELLVESETVKAGTLNNLIQESNELIAILVTCVKRVKGRKS